MIRREGQVTDEYGRLVPGAEIYVFDQAGNSATLTSDGAASLAQPVTTDEFGDYVYYVSAAGVYREDTHYAGKLRYREQVAIGLGNSPSITVTAAAGNDVSSRPLLAGIANPANLQKATLTEAGREGTFVFSTANLSAEVAADPQQGIYVAPSSDATGASGAWVRVSDLTSVKNFGALGDNSTDDGPAADAFVGTNRQRLDFPGGSYVVRPTNTSPFNFGNSTAPVYRAVAVDRSNIAFAGFGATLHEKSRTGGVLSGDVQPIFATDKNMMLGAISNLAWFGLRFDPGNDADAANSNQRFADLVGVSGVRLIATHAQSSEARRGYFSHIQNSENVLIADHYHKNVTGGVNGRYVTNMVISAIVADSFSELIDFDSTCYNVAGGHIAARSISNENQFLDINSGQQITLGNLAVRDLGNVVTINYKTTTAQDYATYVNNPTYTGPPFVVARDIIVSDVVGTNVGVVTGGPVFVGWDWAAGPHLTEDPVRAITLRGSRLNTVAGSFICREAKDLVVSDHHWYDVTSAAGWAALHFFSAAGNADQIAWSDLEIDLLDSGIHGCNRGAVFISTPSRAHLRNFRCTGINSAGGSIDALTLTSLDTRGARVVVDACDIEGNIIVNGNSASVSVLVWAATTAYTRNQIVRTGTGAAGSPFRYYRVKTSGTSGATAPTAETASVTDGSAVLEYIGRRAYEVRWSQTNRVRGTIGFQGDAHKHIVGESKGVGFGDIAATGTVRRTLFIAQRRCYVARGSFSVGAAVAANASNFRTVAFNSVRSGAAAATIASVSSASTSWAANAEIDGGFAAVETESYLEPGDIVYVAVAATGTGAALTDFYAQIEVIDL